MLPALRQELALHAGPAATDGSPTWSLQDPVRNLFFRIDWLTFEILSRWYLNDPRAIVRAIAEETTIETQNNDFEGVVRFLAENELLQRHTLEGSTWYRQQLGKRRVKPLSWLLHHYLFFRIPLWRPDSFLTTTSKLVSPFYTRTFFMLTLLALLFGLIEVSRQWQGFMATLVDTFSWQGLLGFFFALILAKFFHELGHAYTAKRYGCRVPTMGVAFLVLFPMAYTDVNEAWKIKNNKHRLRIGAAGIVTELTLAVWALLAWLLLPDGHLRSAAFIMATTTWISTLIVNASPFLRFDGYFLLMDWLDLPNLHQRAFALGKWQLREWLFSLGEPPPEQLSCRRRRGLILFAWLTWSYRLVVFLGIAVLVYALFPKPLGPFLAAVELGWFIGLPIWREATEWRARLAAIIASRRTWMVLVLLLFMLLLLLFPWDSRIRSQGLLRPLAHYPVFAAGPGLLAALPVAHGAEVEAGEKLLVIDSSDLIARRELIAAQLAVLRWQENIAGLSPQLRERQTILNTQRSQKEVELAAINETITRYSPKAPVSGLFFYRNPELSRNWWVADNEQLGVVLNPNQWQVETYLPEAELHRVKVGNRARFYSETPYREIIALTVVRIDHDATRILSDAILASSRGGEIMVRETARGYPIPETAIYRVTLAPAADYLPATPMVQRGRVVIFGQPKAYLEAFTRSAAALFVRESGF